MSPSCPHRHLQLDVSSHAAEAGFQRLPLAKRQAATTPAGRAGTEDAVAEHARLEALFPGPLVLPGDALAVDPKEPPQSLRSWIQDNMRNPVTQRRKTIYVVPAPQVGPAVSKTVSSWTVPSPSRAASLKGKCEAPDVELVRQYLEAFYYPLPVRLLPKEVRLVPWTGGNAAGRSKKQQDGPQYIGLQVGGIVTRITTRRCPDGAFGRQLRLSNILDAALDALPDDAYALVMLVAHDTYEDEHDDFCCGLAYGGSRIAVVSFARYHPLLDEAAGVDRDHAWPFAHCAAFVERLCRGAAAAGSRKKRKVDNSQVTTAAQPLADIIKKTLEAGARSDGDLSALWLSRVARTVAHEVGHCFCLTHCRYYACSMQSTTCVAEDLRQPPYLCPVCLAKLTRAVRDVSKGAFDETRFLIERYTTLARFCKQWERAAMFAGYRCWLEKRIDALQGGLPAERDLGNQELF
ncbi:uncharacterized protein THITE_2088833 [Thermothielavioides terrestris NRRL 8126]|uniref:Archaemetzincin-2 n=1 Tax=Thermothielavioides terrestris (strain ATCC 38088 / NRRL 8126) TaxID=578455 RepID=G2R155_THETT|nr:uncharacterized protein THITE_2088833 [Thermothielavioides terrestris NRRL 8126]AEO67345.1 hypothetical protein THITE_2088833 [Thermothielavioides terrestris NRRL 8126]